MHKHKSAVTFLIVLFLIPMITVIGALLFREKYTAWIALCVGVLSCVPLFVSFERRQNSSKELAVLAVMIALSVAGRFLFAFIPGFKPVTAITIIAALYLGKESGFAIGALSALLSNFYFGQGPWTPFQMLAWGLIGFLAGLFAKPLKRMKIPLYLFGALMGLLYSAILDLWTTVWIDGTFTLTRYAAMLIAALPTTLGYVISNIIFLLFLTIPIGEKLERIRTKYGLFQNQ